MKRFHPIDLSGVDQDPRDVLAITFPELLDLYCAARRCKRPDLRDYRLRKWRVQFAAIPAWDLAPVHVAAVVSAMESQGYSSSSINRDVADIASCYAWALRRRYCPADFQNPTREFDRRPDAVRRVELSSNQQNRLVAQAKLARWPKMYPLVLMALHTGARKGELMGLVWSDVDILEGRATLHDTKAGTPRRLMLTERVVESLTAIKPNPCPKDAYVFCGRNPFKPFDFRKSWELCRREAGLPGLRFHDLRHASAAQMLKAGNSLHSVAQILGHTDTRMLSRVYGHLDDGHLHAAVKVSWGEVS